MTLFKKDKKAITHKEAQNYFANWIEELNHKIDAGDPDAEKFAEQITFLEIAMGSIGNNEAEPGAFN